jgi:hypothetical protein
MAKIVFGMATSHSPLLALKPEQWALRARDDRENPKHHFRGRTYSFPELVALRREEGLDRQIAPSVLSQRHETNQKRIDLLGNSIVGADLDILVIFGDDQNEIILSDNCPPFMIFNGARIPFMPTSEERLAEMSEAIRIADKGRTPEREMTLRGAPDLANHIIASVKDSFDVAVSDCVLSRPGSEDGVGHAFGFIYHRMLDDLRKVPRMATLPIFINTFFPPNQPSARRAYHFGRAVGAAIRSWPEDLRVGIAASGGLSHFVIDEAFDHAVIEAFQGGDLESLLNQPESIYQSGTSEIKNWIAAWGALEETGLRFEMIDYVPCYRSEGGTGNAMGFARWT